MEALEALAARVYLSARVYSQVVAGVAKWQKATRLEAQALRVGFASLFSKPKVEWRLIIIQRRQLSVQRRLQEPVRFLVFHCHLRTSRHS